MAISLFCASIIGKEMLQQKWVNEKIATILWWALQGIRGALGGILMVHIIINKQRYGN